MKNELIPFSFENMPVRMTVIDGQEWWAARDVAVALGFKSPNRAFHLHCKGIPKWNTLQTEGGTQQMRIINEGDVFRLMSHSNLPTAQRFEKWMFETVLPQIRKTGGYAPLGTALANEGVLAEFRRLQAETRAALTAVNKFVEESQPRIKLLTSEKDRLRQLNRLYEERDALRQQLARKNTPLTESERRQILACAGRMPVAEIARYTGRSGTAVRKAIKKGGAV